MEKVEQRLGEPVYLDYPIVGLTEGLGCIPVDCPTATNQGVLLGGSMNEPLSFHGSTTNIQLGSAYSDGTSFINCVKRTPEDSYSFEKEAAKGELIEWPELIMQKVPFCPPKMKLADMFQLTTFMGAFKDEAQYWSTNWQPSEIIFMEEEAPRPPPIRQPVHGTVVGSGVTLPGIPQKRISESFYTAQSMESRKSTVSESCESFNKVQKEDAKADEEINGKQTPNLASNHPTSTNDNDSVCFSQSSGSYEKQGSPRAKLPRRPLLTHATQMLKDKLKRQTASSIRDIVRKSQKQSSPTGCPSKSASNVSKVSNSIRKSGRNDRERSELQADDDGQQVWGLNFGEASHNTWEKIKNLKGSEKIPACSSFLTSENYIIDKDTLPLMGMSISSVRNIANGLCIDKIAEYRPIYESDGCSSVYPTAQNSVGNAAAPSSGQPSFTAILHNPMRKKQELNDANEMTKLEESQSVHVAAPFEPTPTLKVEHNTDDYILAPGIVKPNSGTESFVDYSARDHCTSQYAVTAGSSIQDNYSVYSFSSRCSSANPMALQNSASAGTQKLTNSSMPDYAFVHKANSGLVFSDYNLGVQRFKANLIRDPIEYDLA